MGKRNKDNDRCTVLKTALFALGIALVIFGVYHHSVSADEITAESGPYLRPIKADYMETLSLNSKWRQEPLLSKLNNIFSEDLSDTSSCQQIWHFTADDFEEVQEWCLAREKGAETNDNFIDKFADNQLF